MPTYVTHAIFFNSYVSLWCEREKTSVRKKNTHRNRGVVRCTYIYIQLGAYMGYRIEFNIGVEYLTTDNLSYVYLNTKSLKSMKLLMKNKIAFLFFFLCRLHSLIFDNWDLYLSAYNTYILQKVIHFTY